MAKAAKKVTPPVKMVKHIVTQEDLDNNADLATQGVKVGDEIEIPEVVTDTKAAAKKEALEAIMQPYLTAYPTNKTFYISTDGQVFLQANKGSAEDHQKNIGKVEELETYNA